MHGQALALSSSSNRFVRVEDSDLRGYTDYELGTTGKGVDFAALMLMMRRYRLMMIGIVLLALAAGAASILLSKPVYRAEAKLEIQPQAFRVTGAENVIPDAGRTENDRILQTQVDLIQSSATARHAADRLSLYESQPFLEEAGLSSRPTGLARDSLVAGALQDRLSISSPSSTRIISIGVDSQDPAFAAKAATTVARTYIDDSLQRRLDTYAGSQRFLEGQLATTKRRLEGVERQLVDYARASGLVDAGNAAGIAGSSGERRSIVSASLVNLNAALSQAEANRMEAQQRWRQAQGSSVMSLPEVLANPAVQELTRKKAELTATLEQERVRRQDEHPAIVQARAQIQELDGQIAAIAGGIRSSIGNQYRIAAGHEGALRSDVNALKAATFGEQSKEVRYNILKREADTNRNLYNTLLQRYHEISAQASNRSNPVSLIDAAEVPVAPIWPRPALNMALAGLAGIVLALGAAFARQRMDQKVHGPSDAERDLQAPLLGVVPAIGRGEDLQTALDSPRSAVTEAHHAICLALGPIAEIGDHGVILLTSTGPGEGKSTTALKLAIHSAGAGQKVLLIDGDMRRGSLHRLLGRPSAPGLANLVSRDSDEELGPLLHRCEPQGIWLLTRGRSNRNPAELLSGDRFAAILAEARVRFDVVIIDGPPVLGLADAPRLGGLADATIFLVEANHTSKDHARMALRRLAEAGATRIGLVIAKYDPAKDVGNVGYGYRYDYPSDDLLEEEAPDEVTYERQPELVS
ncbi:exopolysaccharide regulatory tyrosine autokinase VpsO [Sphingomonas swuensis]|uniref:Exopolysaccharide regulatory tyrosine autokinase VpsO n=1 Tax=Sphingomonas swuensis TaxID=977800 RepID=A0ABP7SZR7_9SPHN